MLTVRYVASYPAPLRLVIFLFILAGLWLPLALPISLVISDRNLATILTMGLLFLDFLLLLQFWGKNVYQQPQLLKTYGLEATLQNSKDLLIGLLIGWLLVFSLFFLQRILGWIEWQPSPHFLPKIALEGLLSALGISFAEELVFRGWLLDELQRDYSRHTSLWVNAAIFAIAHFLKPPSEILRTFITFPALFLLGLTLVWAKRGRLGLLGLPIGLHAGLVWGYYIINIGHLVQYSPKVPQWLTGIDRNPLASLTGLLFLSALALFMYKLARQNQPSTL
ncbi:MAG: CPBP family intramembrane metalloprotease [Oscillatoriaceae bacterium SKW80]|nr:CPBP family intramembrane metalloprotease [Oscillatoriaceae bacterium SKYG93]MCX8121897.1 CPBP family intramembrane metalloprotease [Oscillatoriaceae bacterium SKW80]MDW8454658.1 type II CAAX endopeptidase family protein [Oscillatoriaceae cyanobacterium SKYGB_i_bin93]HIK28637.1 CPBP family intramembrane metalloprotease [Oscillatoriaceae cyanobacterium M7585_C2015_266]